MIENCALDCYDLGSKPPRTPKEGFMTTRSLGLLDVFRSRLIVAATLLVAFATIPTSGSQPKNGTRAGAEILANDETASGRSYVQLAAVTTRTFAWPASVSAENRRFLDQKGNVYLLKAMSSWAMAQNCTNAEITKALEGLKSLGFNAVMVSPFGVHSERELRRQVQEQGRATFLYRCAVASASSSARRGLRWIGSCQKPPGSK